MKHSTILLFCALLLASAAYAQKNVIKTKPLRTIYGIASPSLPIPLNLTYERVIIPKLSLSLNLIYAPKKELPPLRDAFNDAEISFDNGDASVTSFEAQRFYISPEVRFYPAIIRKTPRGLFLSLEPFYSTTQFDIGLEHWFTYYFDNGDASVTYTYQNSYDLKVSTVNIGASVGLGSQWLIADRLSLEVLWIGLGAGACAIRADHQGALIDKARIEQDIEDVTGEPYSIPEDQVPTWETIGEEMDDDFGDFYNGFLISGKQVDVSTREDGVTVTYSGVFPKVRLLNFSVGFAF